MKAVVIRNGESRHYVTMAELPQPVLASAQDVVIQVLSVGLDGTDREIITDNYGDLPAGEIQMVIGHELLGKVVEAGSESGFITGDFVTALVRRPCKDEACINCQHGRQDFCATGKYIERGIKQADGCLCEYIVESAPYVVKLPAVCVELGMLVEPQSIVEKVWSQVQIIQQRMIWKPQTVLVTGSGPLGILAALTCRVLGLDTYVWSNSRKDSINAEIIRKSGAHYQQAGNYKHESGEAFFAGLTAYAAQLNKGFDMIWECSGHTPLGYEAMMVLNPNGVLALLSVTAGDQWLRIPNDRINQEMVLKNKCVMGSVNASRQDFETGIGRLLAIEAQYPGLLNEVMTDRLTIEDVLDIDFKQIQIKAVVDVVSPERWNEI